MAAIPCNSRQQEVSMLWNRNHVLQKTKIQNINDTLNVVKRALNSFLAERKIIILLYKL